MVFQAIQRSILFPRHYIQVDEVGGQGVRDLDRWWLDVEGGRVEAWFLPADGEGPRPAVIFAHGNGEAIDFWAHPLDHYRRLGIHVLLPEYRGYGRSGGEPSEEAIANDMVTFYDRLAAREDVDADRIIFHGRSLGGGAMGALAKQRKPAGLILQSTFTSISAFAKRFMLPDFLVSDPFDTLAIVPQLDIPILVLHGTKDGVVPYDHGATLHAAAKNGELVTYDCGHNDMPSDDRYWGPVEKYLATGGFTRPRDPTLP